MIIKKIFSQIVKLTLLLIGLFIVVTAIQVLFRFLYKLLAGASISLSLLWVYSIGLLKNQTKLVKL